MANAPDDAKNAEDRPLPNGYRQGVITAITVLLSFSLFFMKFWIFEPSEEAWTPLSIAAAILLATSVACQINALWRALQLADDRASHYEKTLKWILAGILFLVCGLLIVQATGSHLP